MRQANYLRETRYAGLIAEGRLSLECRNEFRMERLYVKAMNSEEIRFSWWKNNKLMMRPLDATEQQLLDLFHEGIIAGVFTPHFRRRLRQLLQQSKKRGVRASIKMTSPLPL